METAQELEAITMMQTNLIGEHLDIFEAPFSPANGSPELLVIATGTARAITVDGPGLFTILVELDAGQFVGGRITRAGELMAFSTARVLFRVSQIPAPAVSSPEQPLGDSP